MAFEKRTWFARLGTGLNKFIIGEKDANNKQTLVNAPDSVDQQGDVISADNLNDLEARIESEFLKKIDLANTFNERIWNKPGYFFAWDIERGNLAVNSLNAFENTGLTPFISSDYGPWAMSGDETITFPAIAVGSVLKYRICARNESGNLAVRTLTLKVPSEGVYIGYWRRWSGCYRYRVDLRDDVVLKGIISPSHTPAVSSPNFSDEALLHIMSENYAGYFDRARSVYSANNPITFAQTDNGLVEASGRINVNGGATLGTLNIQGYYGEEEYGYSGISCSLWLYRVS